MKIIEYFKERLIHITTVCLWCCETDTSVVITIKIPNHMNPSEY